MGPDMSGTGRMGSAPSGSSFQFSFWLLPAERRQALRTVYDFCRATDDIVDNHASPEEKLGGLEKWKRDLELAEDHRSDHPLLSRLAAVSDRYAIPFGLYFDLIRGVGMDVTTTRYRTFGELSVYCALVASSVGSMCLGIFGRRNERTEEYARHLGLALQLTNTIRDVAADAAFGRIYLPQEDLVRFGCPEGEILALTRPARFGELMEFEASRAARYYAAADSALRPEDNADMAPARVMAGIYRGTLRKIARSGYDVFGGPIRLSRPVQLFIALRQGLAGALLPR